MSKPKHNLIQEQINVDGCDIAVCKQAGCNPGFFWLSGFKSSMLGQKARLIAELGRERGVSVTRFDYSGHGLSSGAFEEGTISRWLNEANIVFDHYTQGPQIVVGSSMGGWIALLLALEMKARIAGMILIAPAWDMTETLMWQQFSEDTKTTLTQTGSLRCPSAYEEEEHIITHRLIEDGRKHLIGDTLISCGFPVSIIHGRNDQDVPWQHGHALTHLLPHDEVTFTLVPDGDHRLSRGEDLALLARLTNQMYNALTPH